MLSSMTDGEKEREKVLTAARSKGDALVSFEDEGDDDTDDLTTRYENQFEQYFGIFFLLRCQTASHGHEPHLRPHLQSHLYAF